MRSIADDPETWRDIAGAPGYEVSDQGRVRSIDRTVIGVDGFRYRFKGRIRVLKPDRYGYLTVGLALGRHGKVWTAKVHTLVAVAFLPPRADQSMVINHIDGVKTNNRPGNLEWISPSDNTKHAWRIGLADQRGERNGLAKLTESDVREIRRLYGEGWTSTALAARFPVGRTQIDNIVNKTWWRHID